VSGDTEEIQENLSDYLLFVGIQTNLVIILCIYLTIYANMSSTFFVFSGICKYKQIYILYAFI